MQVQRRALLFLLVVLLATGFTGELFSKVTVKSKDPAKQAAHSQKIASWLTMSLGTAVTIDENGDISVADGGNKAADRLRDMANDAGTSVTIEVVENDPNVHFGRWNSSDPANSRGPTTGTQTIDIADFEEIGNVLNSYGITPDCWLMHEITEVYTGVKGGTNYGPAHTKGLEAEKEVQTENGTENVGEHGTWPSAYYFKIKRPDGSYVVVKVDASGAAVVVTWYKEKVPCRFVAADLIEIPDPDPQVTIFSRTMEGDFLFDSALDMDMSSPTGAAHDDAGNLYVCENFSLQGISFPDEIRVFDPAGGLIDVISGGELCEPKGIDVDKDTGEIFVAVNGRILRYSNDGGLIGEYFTPSPDFTPTDVVVWRDKPVRCLPAGDAAIYRIYAADRQSSQVYMFNVDGDMGVGNFSAAFGEDYLMNPEGLAVDDVGLIWVASTGNSRVYRFLPNGDISPFEDSEYFIEDCMKSIYDLHVNMHQGVYVVDQTPGAGGIYLYDLNGLELNAFGAAEVHCPQSITKATTLDLNNLIEMDPPTPDMLAPAAPVDENLVSK